MENQSLNARIESLERTNRRLRAGLACAALVLGSMVLAGARQEAEKKPDTQAEKKPDTPSIHQMFEEDQNDRKAANRDWSKITPHDVEHRRLTHELLASGVLTTAQDFKEASFIFQHGDTPQDILLAHVLAMTAMAKGDAKARWIAAATLDRYLQRVQQPQVFGTQYLFKNPGAKPRVTTQEPYDKDLVSDALRKEFCVTSYDGQQQNVAAENQGKPWPSPDGCH